MNWETFAVSIIASVLAPAILLILTRWQGRKDKEFDWARQDEVARKVEETARITKITSAKVVQIADATNEKLDTIHKLVNSNMTAAILDSLSASTRELAALIELRDQGVTTPDTLNDIAAAKAKIAELTSTLNDRKAMA